ncbi:serpin B4-like [Microcaecilia unicolor]|uniref:Serpin B4-like n=1 Tax=Microcaecilia unicolor TaxID=1415580 RepID=A0A6P7WTK9_9AMPH|nr:serpin B4-like [Microcaecilia unicolor]XP_030063282.1 serpin B4-like [Microcaecilia unicolor]
MDSLAAANASFTFDLYKQLNKTRKNENVFFSPLSIESALAMVLMGAKGNTAAQMEKVLHLGETEEAADAGAGNTCGENVDKQTPLPPPSLPEQQCGQEGSAHSKFHELLSHLQKSDQACELHIANKLYGQKNFPFIEQYLSCVQKLYMAMLENADFKNSEAVRKAINTWVEKETKGKIKDLFAEGSLRPDTVLVLVNAVYFKGKWEKEFKKENTREAQFKLNKRESKPVQMMYQNGKFKLASIPEMHMRILELPYCKHEFSMLILLPDVIANNSTGLDEIENGLTYEKLTNWTTSALREAEVDVYIPAFKLEETYDLGSVLQQMGMKDVFSNAADLSGISTTVGLKVSKVVHKAYVEVNEEGTEAAAATGVTVVPVSLPMRIQFVADHPFIVIIKEIKTNAILFHGKYSSP